MGFFKKENTQKQLKEKQKKHTILLVDDEEANLRSICRLLENDYNVISAKDGLDGINIIKTQGNNIHLVISDQRMPNLSGVDFLKQSVAINPNIVRIILTGYTDIGSIIASINEAQIYKFIVKPIEPEDFLLTIQRALEFYELEMKNIALIQELKTVNSNLEETVKERTKELQNTLRDIKRDLVVAKGIQQSILPEKFRGSKQIKFVTRYFPMQEVGGDFFDIETVSENYIRVFIADATGHGVQAALFTMAIKVEYDAIKKLLFTPDKLLSQLNIQFMKKFISTHAIFSCAILDIDIQNNKILYSAAGHPDQILINHTGVTKLSKTGKIIGIDINATYRLIEAPFSKGRIFLFTDGAYEQFNMIGEEYESERLLQYLIDNQAKNLEECVSNLIQDINSFVIKSQIQDDITIVAIEV
ncbi:MAG: SpoIIE family protein phosphatase [Leptospiraceae bacterium]|nr:SpoIIE family protein phosphatase [Leptospiraceae bacterium]